MIISSLFGNNRAMKQDLIQIVAVIVLIAFALSLTACGSLSLDGDIADKVVRIHIRANSNNPLDQQVKLAVRDDITAYLTEVLDGCKTKSQSLSTIKNSLDEITKIANTTLYRHGFDYKSAVSVKKELFPDKTYDGLNFPEGVYDALIIELGTGDGDNWWCVAFPPLCFVPEGDGEKVEYKSWVKEIIDKIFNK